jgi:O-glycosyl hydrolase
MHIKQYFSFSLKKNSLTILLLGILQLMSSCSKDATTTEQLSSDITININTAQVYQEMDGFGASDAWSCQPVGKNWPLSKKEAIADLLFSKDTDQYGDPKGIGLSIWRFYVGSGSTEQGANSYISDPWKRTECFLNEDGSYDWTKQQGQQWFLNAAKNRGVEKFLMFSYSAPVFYTINKKAFSPGGWHLNIQDGYLPKYADFLTNVVKHFSDEGFNVDYFAPVNEPQWGWNAGSNGWASQEGTPASNIEVATLAKLLSSRFNDKGLSTKITLGEAGSIAFLYETKDADRGHQIQDFFDPSSSNYVGNETNVAKVISGHSYFTVWPVTDLIASREAVHNQILNTNSSLKYWESEYCILEGANVDMADGWVRDLNMDLALYVGRMMHYAIVKGNASSWQWWLALSRGAYKDGLIYLDDGSNQGMTSTLVEDYCNNDGNVRQSKLLWGFGNYSRFVRPGMKRVYTGSPDIQPNQSYGVLTSAFIDQANKKLVVVLINYSAKEKTIAVNMKTGAVDGKFTAYVTSENSNLKRLQNVSTSNVLLQANSITTLVGTYK